MGSTVAKWIKEDKEKWFNGYSCIMLNVLGELQEYNYLEYDNLDIEKYAGLYDVFCTQNTFRSKRRTKDNVLQLRVLWQDIDNVKDIPLTIKKIDKLVEEGEIPPYHQIVDSGTGLHIKWIIKDYSGSKRNIRAWEKLQKDFYKKLKSLGADKGALDVARVLRVVGSINSKNNHVVKMITNKPILPYDLWELYNKYIYVPAEKPKKNTRKSKSSNIRLFTSNYNLNKTRLADFEKLLEIRHNKMDSIRNKFMMLYGTYYILSGASSEATEEKLRELNKKIRSKKRASNSEIKTIVRNGLKRAKISLEDPKVLPKNETIIEMLDIAIEEQKVLKTIISKEVKNNRRNERKRENRRNKNGLTNREQKKQDLIKKITELKDNGYKQVEIAEKLNISKGRVSQVLNRENKELNKNSIDDVNNDIGVDILIKTKEEITKELPENEQVQIKEIENLNKYKNYRPNELNLTEDTQNRFLKKFNELAT